MIIALMLWIEVGCWFLIYHASGIQSNWISTLVMMPPFALVLLINTIIINLLLPFK